jgi:hypothetical protein
VNGTKSPRDRLANKLHRKAAGRLEVKLTLAATAVASTLGGWAALAQGEPPAAQAGAADSGAATLESLSVDLPPFSALPSLPPLRPQPDLEPLPPLVRAAAPGAGLPAPRAAAPVTVAPAPAPVGAAPAVPPATAVEPARPAAAPPPDAMLPAPAQPPARVVVVPAPRPAAGRVAAVTRSSR